MISRRLREFRDKYGLSQEGIAKIGRMSQASWGNWEREPLAAFESIVAIANHFGVSVDYLLGLTDDETPNREKIDETLADLISVIRKLPEYRQHDLLGLAKLFEEEKFKDYIHAQNVVLEHIRRIGGKEAEDLLIDLFDSIGGGTKTSGGSSSPFIE